MKKILLPLFLMSFIITYSQKFYDASNSEYFIDYSKNSVKLKFKNFLIQGKFQEVKDKLYENYLVVEGNENRHYVLQCYLSKSAFYGIDVVEGNLDDVINEVKKGREYKNVKVLFTNLPSYSKMKDLKLISEAERDRELIKIKEKEKFTKELSESGLEGVYKIKILKHGGIDYKILNETGQLFITSAGITLKTDIPSISLLRGSYIVNRSEVSKSQFSCNLNKGFGDAFTLVINKFSESQVGAISVLIGSRVKTTTFKIIK